MSYNDDAVKAKFSALAETQDSIVTVAQWVMFYRSASFKNPVYVSTADTAPQDDTQIAQHSYGYNVSRSPPHQSSSTSST